MLIFLSKSLVFELAPSHCEIWFSIIPLHINVCQNELNSIHLGQFLPYVFIVLCNWEEILTITIVENNILFVHAECRKNTTTVSLGDGGELLSPN
jgi:hypothetical protein